MNVAPTTAEIESARHHLLIAEMNRTASTDWTLEMIWARFAAGSTTIRKVASGEWFLVRSYWGGKEESFEIKGEHASQIFEAAPQERLRRGQGFIEALPGFNRKGF